MPNTDQTTHDYKGYLIQPNNNDGGYLILAPNSAFLTLSVKTVRGAKGLITRHLSREVYELAQEQAQRVWGLYADFAGFSECDKVAEAITARIENAADPHAEALLITMQKDVVSVHALLNPTPTEETTTATTEENATMTTLKTTVNTYRFDTRKPEEKAAYKALCAELTAQGLACFESHGGQLHATTGRKLQGHAITLETKHLFSNQWNTAPIAGVSDIGLRVFDWAQDSAYAFQPANHALKQGYWLQQSPAMAEVRRNTHACGYCGKQEPAAKGNVFCPHCIGGEYLKASGLKLLRMQAVDDTAPRAELSEAEKAHLLPIWRNAQLHGNTARDKKRIADAIQSAKTKAAKAIHAAETERDGFLWLISQGINTNNVIFYAHTGRFSFGWRNAVDAELESQLLDVISEFSWAYDIKCADGRVLSGN